MLYCIVGISIVVGEPIMAKAIDLTGKVYGKLTVVDYSHTENGKRMWNTVCECGNTAVFSASSLKAEYNKSCGCTIIRYPEDMVVAHRMYNKYKTRSIRETKRDFELSFDEFYAMTQQTCHYCGVQPSLTTQMDRRLTAIPFTFNGIDRVDNTKGYIKGNVVACCRTCNFMKHSMNQQAFIEQAIKIADHSRMTKES